MSNKSALELISMWDLCQQSTKPDQGSKLVWLITGLNSYYLFITRQSTPAMQLGVFSEFKLGNYI